MPSSTNPSPGRIARVLAVIAVAFGAGMMSWLTASAAPPLTPVAVAETPVLSATLESSRTAVSSTETFGYTAHIRLTKPASYLQTRIRVLRPSGRLVFQRTLVGNDVSAGEHSASFSRTLEGINLLPGAYPVEVEIRADVSGSTVTTEIATELLVYDSAQRPSGVVLLTRINAQPLEAPDGRFAFDPAEKTKARDDVVAIASLILADADARLTLSIPPAVLGEWRRASDGYTLEGGTEVSATDPVAVSYADALDLLREAIGTGRLELVSTGLADPDLARLAGQGMSGDIVPQYEAGLLATLTSLETSPSAGTVPAGVCIPPATLSALAGLDIGYVALDSGCARSSEGTVASGSYRIANSSIRALLSDSAASRALSSAQTTVALERIAARQIIAPIQPVIVRVELTDGGPGVTETLVPALRVLQREPWARLELGRDARPPVRIPSVRLLADRTGTAAPKDYWNTVSRARAYASALSASLGPLEDEAVSALTNSLIAESSAWSEPEGTWAGAARGQLFAEAAMKTSRSILDKLALKIESVTLSSDRGEIPVSIQNGSGRPLRVTMRTSTLGGIDVDGDELTSMVLRPRETFIQIPVNMHSALSGQLIVELLAGDLVVANRTVDVRASYLDRLVIIGGIVLALGVLLAFIVRRVRAVERAERDTAGVRDQSERYTDTPTGFSSDSEDE